MKKTKINNKSYKLRKTIVEHPFGTIKRHYGYTYFNRKGLANTDAEASSFCVAYNLKRAINIIGVMTIIEKINQRMDNFSSFLKSTFIKHVYGYTIPH
ncbi:MAG: transposase [Bacilli bacterium]|nr:transposase [Bacilli bacterium]